MDPAKTTPRGATALAHGKPALTIGIEQESGGRMAGSRISELLTFVVLNDIFVRGIIDFCLRGAI